MRFIILMSSLWRSSSRTPQTPSASFPPWSAQDHRMASGRGYGGWMSICSNLRTWRMPLAKSNFSKSFPKHGNNDILEMIANHCNPLETQVRSNEVRLLAIIGNHWQSLAISRVKVIVGWPHLTEVSLRHWRSSLLQFRPIGDMFSMPSGPHHMSHHSSFATETSCTCI